MKKHWFLIRIGMFCILALMASCGPTRERAKRYDVKECPFCSLKPGECNYCHGTKKCTFCNGTGVRKTTTDAITNPAINQVTYVEKCAYCNATGVCRYCDGVGRCWACKGSGKIENWNILDGKDYLNKDVVPTTPTIVDTSVKK